MNDTVRELRRLFEVGSLGGLSDGQLLDRFVARREAGAFEAIVRRHGPMVWGVCRRVLLDHHDAEDAFQATFLVLARRAASVMVREKLGHWLYGVAYQTAMKARAMRAKRRARETRAAEMQAEATVGHHDLGDDLAASLDRELSRLPAKYRVPIVLCELEGKTHREAAEQLGWPIGTVSSRLSRGRSMLAGRLARRGVLLSAGSLAVLLARESASACMPTKLIGATARAASLFATGSVMSPGTVPAGVAALTREVLKVMLLSKLKVGVVMLMVASAVAAGGTGLGLQAQTTGPGGKDDLPWLNDEKREELERLIGTQRAKGRRTEAGPLLVGESPIGLPPGLEGIDEASPDQLRRHKEYIDAMIAVEDARTETPEQLDEMIRAKTKILEDLRWCAQVTQMQISKLKKIRDGARIDKIPALNSGVSVGSPIRP